MAIRQARPKRKASGKRYVDYRKKQLSELGRTPSLTKIDDNEKIQDLRVKAGSHKRRMIRATYANVLNKATGKYSKVKIKTVLESPSNIYYLRRNIIVRGTIIDTEAGKARVTSRPGQHGVINAVLTK